MALPTAEEIINYYLYGQSTKPSDIETDSIIRPSGAGVTIDLQIEDVMAGPGRFAIGPVFTLVTRFFSTEGAGLPPGTYTKAQLADIFGLSFFGEVLLQRELDDRNSIVGADDYAERTFIFNTTAWQLIDEVRFVVEPGGNRFIENYGVEPSVTNGDLGDFDFQSIDMLAQAFGSYLEYRTDISQIGRTVDFNIVGSVTPRVEPYTIETYFLELEFRSQWEILPERRLFSETGDLLEDLFGSGATKFLDGDDRVIVYGTTEDDELVDLITPAQGAPFDEGRLHTHPYYRDFYTNGVHYITGTGEDEVTGTGFDDVIELGAGNDSSDAARGDDEVLGDDGNDTLSGGEGNDTLFGEEDSDDLNGGEDDDIVVGGVGSDTVAGGAGADELYNGNDDESDDGSADTLDGGDDSERDTFYAGNGDTIINAGDNDVLIINGEEVSGTFERDEEGGDYVLYKDESDEEDNGGAGNEGGNGPGGCGDHDDGEEPPEEDEREIKYRIDANGNLTVEDTGVTVSIQGFNSGNLGIVLEEHKDDEEDQDDNNDNGGQGGGGCGPQPTGGGLGSPLVLDLDNDGFDLINVQRSRAYFDIDNDGFAERTGWIRPSEAFLALDRNDDGEINGQSELFGYSNIVRGAEFPEDAVGSGYALLAEFDDNDDGVIDAADAVFTDLTVWRDLNSDGFSDADEMFTLADFNIASIDVVNFDPDNPIIRGSNLLTDFGTFTFGDGSTSTIADIYFGFDSHITRFDDRGIDVSGVEDLPDLNGYGEFTDLRVAMAMDPSLEGVVRDLASLDASNAADFFNQFEEMIYVWFGVNEVDPNSRISTAYGYKLQNVDARKLAVVETMTGRPFLQERGGVAFAESDPRPIAGGVLTEIYRTFESRLAAQFLTQTDLGAQLFPELEYKAGAFLVVANGTSISTVVDRFVANAPADFYDKIAYWAGMTKLLNIVVGEFVETETAVIAAIDAALTSEGLPGDFESISRGAIGSDHVDVVTGQNSVTGEQLEGGGLDDRINDGANILLSGAGDDIMDGFAGPDIYVWGRGQGNDVIREYDFGGGRFSAVGRDKILLHDLTLSEVSVEFQETQFGSQIIVTILDTNETLTIESSKSDNYPDFQFADSGVIEADSFIGVITPSGTENNDVIQQRIGDETTPLDGLGGDDKLFGTQDASTFVFGAGYGRDVVQDAGRANGAIDTVNFLAGLTPDDLEFSRSGSRGKDLVITIAGAEDSLVIRDQYAGRDVKVEEFFFEDAFGGPLTLTAASITFSFLSTSERDDLQGTRNDDRFFIEFAGGSYTAVGYDGADSYEIEEFQFAGGELVLTESGSEQDVDRILLESVLRDDVTFSNEAGNIVITSNDSGARIVVDIAAGAIEEYVFEDITLQTDDVFEAILADQVAGSLIEIAGTTGDDTLIFDSPNLLLVGDRGDDLLDSGAGEDRLEGGRDDDTLIGGAGDDTLVGGSGEDTYVYNAGDGVDIVADQGGSVDTLIISGYDVDDVSLNVFRGTVGEFVDELFLELTFAGSSDKLYLLDPTDFRDRIDEIQFDNGGVLSFPFTGVFLGGAGDDLLFGADDDDTLDGGAGTDQLFGGRGDDDFVFGLGYGQDTVFEIDRGDFNAIVLNADTTPADVMLTRVGENLEDLQLQISGTSDTLTVINAFGRDTVNPLISEVQFDDGTIWDSSFLASLFAPETAGDDFYAGSNESDFIAATAGDDTLHGGNGGDTYQFGVGSGVDRIVDTGDGRVVEYEEDDGVIFGTNEEIRAETDTVEFGPGIAVGDLIVSAVGENLADLSIAISGASDTLIIERQLAPEVVFVGTDESGGGEGGEGGGSSEEIAFATGIEKFVFDDGTELTREDMNNLISSRANEGDDQIVTGDLGGVLDGGAGNDTLSGGAGSDTYIFARGYGEETISDSGGEDILEIGSDISVSDLQLTRMGENGQDLLIEVGGLERLTAYISGQFADDAVPIDFIDFDNGDSLTAADLRNLILSGESTEADDDITGFIGDDVIRGLRGADTIAGLEGDDAIDGGLGRDKAVYRGVSTDYSIVNNADGTITVTDLAPETDGDDGEDTLINVEDIVFLGDNTDVPVAPVNGAPTASNDGVTTDEDVPLTISAAALLANDSDPDGDVLEISALSNVTGGSAFINGDGDVVFTPNANFNGVAGFDYTVVDPDGAEATASVAVTVNAVNDAPIAVDDAFSTEEDQPITIAAADLFVNDVEVDGEVLSLQSVQDFVGGVAVINPAGDVDFTPDANFNGEASFSYTAIDAGGEITTATVVVSVASIPDAPTATADAFTIDEDTPLNIDVSALLANDTSVEGSPEVINFGNFDNVFAGFAADGSIDITPFPNFNGTGSFDYTIIDDSGETSTATVSVTVNAVDDAPLPQADFLGTDENQALTVAFSDLLANDVELDGETLSLVSATNGSNGSVSVDFVSGTVTFTPDTGFFGGASFSYTVEDENGNQASTFAFVNVLEIDNQPPTDISLSNASVDENSAEGTVVGDLAATDPDAGENFIFRVKPPNDSLFTVSGTQLVVAAGAVLDFETSPLETIEIEVEDSAGNLFSKTFDITINDVDEGTDPIVGTPQDDTLTGTPGDDIISALAGNDVVQALDGDDIIDPGLGSDTIDGGAGFDLLDLSATSEAVYAYLDSNYASGADYGSNFLSNIEGVIGGGGNDQFVGNAQDNSFTGNDGADGIYARDGADTIDGGAGDDYLHGEGGDDAIDGGADNDSIYAGAGADVVDGGSGNDTVFGQQGDDTINGGLGDDTIYTEDGDDRILFTRGDGMDVVYNANGDDTLEFDASVSGSDLTFTMVNQELFVGIDGETDSIELKDYFNSSGPFSFTIVAGDGTVFTKADVEAILGGGGAAPVVLDLDGDGVELVSARNSHVRFDFDGDGARERGGWVGRDDGYLALDRNGNGRIDDISEISFLQDAPGATSDLEGLAAFDTNSDGALSAADERFDEFLVWQDRNQNGRSEFFELKSLSEIGIESLSPVGAVPSITPPQHPVENTIVGEGAVLWSDGHQSALGDVVLRYDETQASDRASWIGDLRDALHDAIEARDMWRSYDDFGGVSFGSRGLLGDFHGFRSILEELRTLVEENEVETDPASVGSARAPGLQKSEGEKADSSLAFSTVKLGVQEWHGVDMRGSESALREDAISKIFEKDAFDFRTIKLAPHEYHDTGIAPWAFADPIVKALEAAPAMAGAEAPAFGHLIDGLEKYKAFDLHADELSFAR